MKALDYICCVKSVGYVKKDKEPYDRIIKWRLEVQRYGIAHSLIWNPAWKNSVSEALYGIVEHRVVPLNEIPGKTGRAQIVITENDQILQGQG